MAFLLNEATSTLSAEIQQAPDLPASQTSQVRLESWIPASISARDVDKYARLLGLSEAQMAFATAMHGRYEESINALDSMHASELTRLSMAGGAAFEAGFSPEAAELFQQFAERQEAKIRAIVECDQSFFAQIETVLAPEQLGGLARARRTRERERCLPIYDVFPAGQIDLVQLIDQMELSERSMAAIDQALDDYELRSTRLFVDLRKEIDGKAVEKTWAFVRARYDDGGARFETGSEQARSRLAAYWEWSERLLSRKADLLGDIAQLNGQHVEQLALLLPEDEGHRLRWEFRSRAYRPVYPDPLDLTAAHQAVRSSTELSAVSKRQIEELWQVYREQYDAISRRMVDRYLDWCRHSVKTERQDGMSEYQRKMSAWRLERWALGDSFLQTIEYVYANELPTEVMSIVAQHRTRFQIHKEVAENDPLYPR